MWRHTSVFLAGDAQPMHEQGQGCRHIPAPSPGSALLLLHPIPASDTPCLSPPSPSGCSQGLQLIPGLGCAPADPAALWDPPLVGTGLHWDSSQQHSGNELWSDGEIPPQHLPGVLLPPRGAGWGLHCPSSGGSTHPPQSWLIQPGKPCQGVWLPKALGSPALIQADRCPNCWNGQS